MLLRFTSGRARFMIMPMFNIALVEPEIPPNTGNIARLCAATNTTLHIVGVAGFRLDDRAVRRAGLDYWEYVQIKRHVEMEDLFKSLPDSRFWYLTTKSARAYTSVLFEPGDCLVFGPETKGLPESLLNSHEESCLTIPMANENVRSLNLANCAGIVLYEAIRQVNQR